MFELSSNSLSGNARRVRSMLLALCCSPLVGAYFYNQNYRVSFIGCPLRHWTGIPCPTCGMTRSFMAIVRGDLSQAVAEHLFGPVLFTGFLIATVHMALEVVTGRQLGACYISIFKRRKIQVLCLVMFFSYYLLRLCYLSETGELYFAFIRSPVGQMLINSTNAS